MKKLTLITILFCLISTKAKEDLLIPKQQAHPKLAKRIQSWIKSLDSSAKSQDFLIKIGPLAAPHLFKALENKKILINVKKKILKILENVPHPKKSQAVLALVKNKQEDKKLRKEAAFVLANFNDASVLADIQPYAFSADVSLNKAITYTICKIGGKEAISHLISLLKHVDSDIVQKAHKKLRELTKQDFLPQFSIWEKWWKEYKDIFEEKK